MKAATTKEMKILMVEDEKYVVDQYRSLVEKRPGIRIVYDTGSEKNALRYLSHHKVDAMILDLELQEGDGISLLSQIEELGMDVPFTIVVTNTVSNVTLSYARMHGADYVYQKMNAGYSPVRVLSLVEKLSPFSRFAMSVEEHPLVLEFARDKEETIIRNNLMTELEMMGIKRKMVGFNYLVEAILLYANCPEENVYVMIDIYPEVARIMKTSTGSVEKSIRCAIEAAFTKANITRLHRFYPFPYKEDRGRPTNTEFIENMASRIRIHEQDLTAGLA